MFDKIDGVPVLVVIMKFSFPGHPAPVIKIITLLTDELKFKVYENGPL